MADTFTTNLRANGLCFRRGFSLAVRMNGPTALMVKTCGIEIAYSKSKVAKEARSLSRGYTSQTQGYFFACDGDAIFLQMSRRQRAAKIACVATLAQVMR